ncbi:flagellar motor switch protein FliN [Xenorhabdus nematophila]|uniref:Flagellar motor switch protein FliN n=1 Tax=Xenorhabdus nematophila (strain ATCC 19061 / DSM 3370 / CCUG 14189 / LMG 1036 / NCIMB 9965 / AN6) TaxID=406817 RepID=D3VC98_XENNA|nr:flagellar motor switch protein FliN [Xenorhabdus nematophila]CEE92501.1 flagellar biosynthesis; component of motor switch and energizing [Xenorhabdus nematophila str. Anatoliense]CEF32192.1 flagellar biosynthesis; component of motor switch and energizing [Xenorhabdus nematophila str. Websteri]AYA40602.1 flagellar motor switch protein FliN [Xenorhabdus nematophila]KHD29249.1 flagellar motor switch protein FliN [Xenorhabdus nematophila]MBA0019341.1 flagellar motor switch protein FliN [Xenorha
MSDAKQPTDTSLTDDMWAEALEQQAAQQTSDGGASIFENLEPQDVLSQLSDIDLIMDIPVKLSVELGRTKMTIKQLLKLSQGSVVSLDGLAGEPLDILINGYLIAQGEVVVVSDKYGIRITDIITPSERMRRLSR